jgi:hypothetical protein
LEAISMPLRRPPLAVALLIILSTACLGAPRPLLLGVIGDTQKPDGDPLTDLRWGLGQIEALPLDAMLMPGDLTDTGTTAQWSSFMGAVDGFAYPIVYAAGNHDAVPGEREYRGLFRHYTGQPAYARFEVGDWQLFVLDTCLFVDGHLEHKGRVSEAQLRWLKGQLEGVGPDEPIMVMAHHPFGEPSDGIDNWERVLSAFEGHDLRLTLTGHFHRNRLFHSEDGTPHLTTGALSFSTAPDRCGIGYRLLSLVGDELHTVWVEREDPELAIEPLNLRLGDQARVALESGMGQALLLRYRGGPVTVLIDGEMTGLPASPEGSVAVLPLPEGAAAVVDLQSASDLGGEAATSLVTTASQWETLQLAE